MGIRCSCTGHEVVKTDRGGWSPEMVENLDETLVPTELVLNITAWADQARGNLVHVRAIRARNLLRILGIETSSFEIWAVGGQPPAATRPGNST